ncbi:MAG: hypothetical protein WC701_03915 [Kiritimatiellales bacterium]|jgi:hypothetical protein
MKDQALCAVLERDQDGILFHAGHDARFMDDKSTDDKSSCAAQRTETVTSARRRDAASTLTRHGTFAPCEESFFQG